MPSNALRHALGQKCTDNFELLRGFIPFQGIVPPSIHYYGQVLQIGESLGSSCDHYNIADGDPLSVYSAHILVIMAGKSKLVYGKN